MDSLEALATWAAPLLARLDPGARRTLARRIGTDLRRSQSRRIASQANPDGSAYAPRKREQSGAIKRRAAMFGKIRAARHMRVTADAGAAGVEFVGRVARIAQVHQYGAPDSPSPGGKRVRYARRELLGFTAADRRMVEQLLLDHLAGV